MSISLFKEQSVSDISSVFTLKFGTEARVAALTNGRIAVTWSEPFGDRSIHLRLFSADGTPLGDSKVVNAPSEHLHADSQIVALADGGFLVSWSMEISGGEDNVFARAYTAAGVPRSAPFMVSPDGGNMQATEDDDRFGDALGLADGGAILVWEARGPNELYGRTLAADGVTLGEPVLLNAGGEDAQLIQLANGDVLVVVGGGSNTGVRVRLSAPDLISAPKGIKGADEPVVIEFDQAPGEHQSVSGLAPNFVQPLADGGFVMGYRHDADIRYETPIDTFRIDWFDAGAELVRQIDMAIPAPPEGEESSIGQIIALEDGRLVVIWQILTEAEGFNLLAQLLNEDGSAATEAQPLATHVAGQQVLYEAELLANGNVAVVWADGSNAEVEGGVDPLHLRVIEIGGGTTDPEGPTVGDDVLRGTRRPDRIDALAGDDVLRGLGGSDRLNGGAGNDTLVGGGGHDRIAGDAGNDRLLGNGGRDILSGGAGRDVLSGGGGNDRLDGGAGKDRLTGGAGADAFIFASPADAGRNAASRDIITDFRRGADVIDLSDIDANAGKRGNQDFDFIGRAGFSETAGELRFAKGIVMGDVDGDGRADFQIAVNGLRNLGVDDFLL